MQDTFDCLSQYVRANHDTSLQALTCHLGSKSLEPLGDDDLMQENIIQGCISSREKLHAKSNLCRTIKQCDGLCLESLWHRKYSTPSDHILSQPILSRLIHPCLLMTRMYTSFAQSSRHSLTILHIPNTPTMSISDSAQREAAMQALATATEATVSRVVRGNESALQRNPYRYVITTKEGTVNVVERSWRAALTTLYPQFTPNIQLPCPDSGSQTFAARSHRADKHSNDQLSVGQEPAASASSTKKRARPDTDREPSNQALYSFDPSMQTEKNEIFAHADRVKATKISPQAYWMSHPEERRQGGKLQSFTLSATLHGVPVERTVQTWESLKDHLYPFFVRKADRQFDPDVQDEGYKVFERRKLPKRTKNTAQKIRMGKERQVMSEKRSKEPGHSQAENTEVEGLEAEERPEGPGHSQTENAEGEGSEGQNVWEQQPTWTSVNQWKTPQRDGKWRSYN